MAWRKVILVVSVVAVVCLGHTVTAPSGGRELTVNCELYGQVTVHGNDARVGAAIQAYADGVLLADTTVRTSGYYEILIPSDDPVTLEKDGWNYDDEITLTVNGEAARPTILAFEGSKQVDISVQLASDVRRSTWGKIKALFR
jgi:hypothetical protein